VCALLTPFRSTLDSQQVAVVTHCFSGFVTKCSVEYHLDWLDDLVEQRDSEGLNVFGTVAAGLYRLAAARSPAVYDGFRPFPVTPDGWKGHGIERGEFVASIAGRLYDLEAREAAPKVIPHVIRAFGLEPKSDPKDVATSA
jgi:hypothetical protein